MRPERCDWCDGRLDDTSEPRDAEDYVCCCVASDFDDEEQDTSALDDVGD